MNDKYILDFITQEDFENHVANTLKQYEETLKSINLKKFNKNIIDPIKLLFDKNIFNQTFEETIKMELQRQRDKTNNNIIGYFHQNIFKYIKNCIVPAEGWDIIYTSDKYTYYIEMKNKHNTMNSSSEAKTFMRMQNHLLNAKDKNRSICALVEVIASKSQNIEWIVTLDKLKQKANKKLRRISIDKFYDIVTNNKKAFNLLCIQLPITIKKVMNYKKELLVEKDTVIEELKDINDDLLLSLYKLAFSTYEGFNFDK